MCSSIFVAGLCKDIQMAIPDIVDFMRNSNQEVSNSVLELFLELVACGRYYPYCLIVILNSILQFIPVMLWK